MDMTGLQEQLATHEIPSQQLSDQARKEMSHKPTHDSRLTTDEREGTRAGLIHLHQFHLEDQR